jgi:hypothetical protein
MRTPGDGQRILSHRLLLSPEKSFHLPVYAEVLAQASLITSPTIVAPSRFLGDPRVLKFMDVSAVEDAPVLQPSIVCGGVSSDFSSQSSSSRSNSAFEDGASSLSTSME